MHTTAGAAMATWDFLHGQATASDHHDLGSDLPIAIADELIHVLASGRGRPIEEAEAALVAFYLGRLSKAPASVAAAAGGEDSGDTIEAAAFALGQIGMAHAVAARAASRQIDDRFEERILSRQYERYVRLLIDDDLSGKEIAQRLGVDVADVSRRLKVLRAIGAVDCRREGKHVVNFLTGAARSVASARRMGSLSGATRFNTAVRERLDERRQGLPRLMRSQATFAMDEESRAA